MVILSNWKQLLYRCKKYCLKCPCETSQQEVENLINAMLVSLLRYEQDLQKLNSGDNLNDNTN